MYIESLDKEAAKLGNSITTCEALLVQGLSDIEGENIEKFIEHSHGRKIQNSLMQRKWFKGLVGALVVNILIAAYSQYTKSVGGDVLPSSELGFDEAGLGNSAEVDLSIQLYVDSVATILGNQQLSDEQRLEQLRAIPAPPQLQLEGVELYPKS